jgi:hypothetical protein
MKAGSKQLIGLVLWQDLQAGIDHLVGHDTIDTIRIREKPFIKNFFDNIFDNNF